MSESAEVPVETPVVKTQDDALEAAFVAGTLPEVDRRAPEPAAVAEPVVRSLEDRVEVGGIIERTAQGWHVSLMYGGARKLHGDGATLENALLDAGV